MLLQLLLLLLTLDLLLLHLVLPRSHKRFTRQTKQPLLDGCLHLLAASLSRERVGSYSLKHNLIEEQLHKCSLDSLALVFDFTNDSVKPLKSSTACHTGNG